MSARDELSGWGAIASYLGVTERSAQAYERKLGLPVHRMPGNRGRVWALAHEIDAWKQAGDATVQAARTSLETEPPRWRRRAFLWAAAVLIPAILSYWYIARQRGPASGYAISGRSLIVFDDQKRIKWTHEFPHYPVLFNPAAYPRALFSDFDGDGRIETLFIYDGSDKPGSEISMNGAELCFFDEDGRLKWTRRFGTAFGTPGGQNYPAALYAIRLLGRLHNPRPDGGVIVAVASHLGSWVCELEIYTATGQKVGTYLHPGWLLTMVITDLNHDGIDDIILGGVNNGYGEHGFGATLVVLNSRSVSGQGLVPAGDPRQANGFATGVESAVLLFPDFTQDPDPSRYCRIDSIVASGDYVEAVSTVGWTLSPRVHYRLDHTLRITSIQPEVNVEKRLVSQLPPSAGPLARRQLIMRTLGALKVLRNDYAQNQQSQLHR